MRNMHECCNAALRFFSANALGEGPAFFTFPGFTGKGEELLIIIPVLFGLEIKILFGTPCRFT